MYGDFLNDVVLERNSSLAAAALYVRILSASALTPSKLQVVIVDWKSLCEA
jgi:hypothetical protein